MNKKFCISPLVLCCLSLIMPLQATALTFQQRVASSADDAEQSAKGTISFSSSDLEFVRDSSNQTVGLLFRGINLPPDSTISNAYLEFTVDETGSEGTSLLIQGERSSNAADFSSATNNISLRSRTNASVLWQPEPWTQRGAKKRTPNISNIIQEAISLPNWNAGNKIVFIITGSGKRTAESYDKSRSNAALLHIEYTASNGGGGGGGQCTDTSGYRDAQGYSCSDWVGYDCSTAVEDWGYTQSQEQSIMTNCALSCKLCDSTGGGGGGGGSPNVTINPYASVNWSTFKQYKANFHSHTTRSDGNDSPAVLIDQYHSAGYQILAITDHDTITWPWTNYGRNPASLNMLAIKGDEYSSSHHVNVFGQFSTAANTLERGIPHVQSSGGLCHINHPKRYSTASDWNWYLPWYRDYPACVGIEVVNRDTVFPELWDNINQNFFAQHNKLTWGFANDDTHSTSDLYRAYQFMLMPNLSESELIKSKKAGAFYFCSEPGGSGSALVPRITSIDVSNSSKRISVNATNFTSISWVGPGSKVVGTGTAYDFSLTPSKSFVRAILRGSRGVCYTQPFGITLN